MCVIVKRNYSPLCVRVINCEIRVVVYTFLELMGNEKRKKLIPKLILFVSGS